jgi:hypothetical protein
VGRGGGDGEGRGTSQREKEKFESQATRKIELTGGRTRDSPVLFTIPAVSFHI